MGSSAAHTWLCQIPVSGSEHSEPCGADSPGFSEWSVRGEQLRRGGRGESGSVRSCLLIPELTASLRVRQTPHPTALPPRRNAHTPLLHATFHHVHPPRSLLRCAPPCSRYGGTEDAASCWGLFAPRLTHTVSHTPLLVDGVIARGCLVQKNGMQTGGGAGGEADSAAPGCPD